MSRQGILIVLLLLSFLFYQTYRESQTIGKIVLVCITSYISFLSLQIIQNTPLIYNRLGALFTFFNPNSMFEIDTSLINRSKYLTYLIIPKPQSITKNFTEFFFIPVRKKPYDNICRETI